MRRLRLMRRLTSGVPGVALAALMLFARLVTPALALPSAADPFFAAAICHADASGTAPAKTDHADERDCLLCPACHLASHAVLPVPIMAIVPASAVAARLIGPTRSTETPPPRRTRSAAQPTGPPDLSD